MKTFGTQAFVNQVLAGLLVTIGFGGTVGLGTVWMRHQVSVVADSNRALEQQYREVERHISDAKALVESEMSSDVLRHDNETMHLGLVEMTQSQVLAVNEDPMRRLVARASQRASESERGASGIGIRFNVQSDPSDAGAAAPAATAPANPAAVPPVAATPTIPSPSANRPARLQFAFTP